MKRGLAAAVATLSLALAGCAVPHERDTSGPIEKASATDAEVARVYDRYREVRNAAAELLDPKPLSTVETGPVLAIDTGSFEVSQRLQKSQKQDTGRIEVTDVQTPMFSKYPLWYYAVVRDSQREVQRVQVWERTSAVDPWLLVATPEALGDTQLPEIRSGAGGEAMRVGATNGAGLAMSPQDAAQAYAATLTDPEAEAASTITDDGFIRQMRDAAATNASLDGVSFSQTWKAEDVDHVLRTSDGGALAFVTLLRTDTYTVKDGLRITWPEGSPQQAFLQDGIQGTGTLNYYHQLLVQLPPGKAKPRAIAQFGGVVSGDVG